MNRVRPKQQRVRLDDELYEQLRNEVLRRDGCEMPFVWRNVEPRGPRQTIRQPLRR